MNNRREDYQHQCFNQSKTKTHPVFTDFKQPRKFVFPFTSHNTQCPVHVPDSWRNLNSCVPRNDVLNCQQACFKGKRSVSLLHHSDNTTHSDSFIVPFTEPFIVPFVDVLLTIEFKGARVPVCLI